MTSWLDKINAFTDGEVVDAYEHCFWGMDDGLTVELGALDRSPTTNRFIFILY